MIKGCAFLVVGFMCLLMVPICIGIGGGLIGLIFGLIGGLFGVIAGIFGAIFGMIGWIIKSFFHLLFGWNCDWGLHPFHVNGFFTAAILVLIIVLLIRRKD